MLKKFSVSLLILMTFLLVLTGFSFAKELKLAHIYAPDHPFQTASLMIARDVEEKTDGSLKINVFPAGQLGSEQNIVQGISTGIVDIALAGTGELGKWHKPLLVFEAAYAFDDVDHMYRVINSEIGKDLYQGFYDESGMRILGTLYYGTRHMTTKNTPVRKPEDLDGLKLRTPDQPQSVANAKALGANPTPMAFSEVYMGLNQGVVDGQENPIATIASMKFNEVQNYLSLTGHVVQAIPIVINDEVYKSLTDKEREVLNEAVAKHVETNKILVEEYTNTKLNEFKESGMEIIEPDREAFKERVMDFVPEWEDQWGEGLYEKIQNVE